MTTSKFRILLSKFSLTDNFGVTTQTNEMEGKRIKKITDIKNSEWARIFKTLSIRIYLCIIWEIAKAWALVHIHVYLYCKKKKKKTNMKID